MSISKRRTDHEKDDDHDGGNKSNSDYISHHMSFYQKMIMFRRNHATFSQFIAFSYAPDSINGGLLTTPSFCYFFVCTFSLLKQEIRTYTFVSFSTREQLRDKITTPLPPPPSHYYFSYKKFPFSLIFFEVVCVYSYGLSIHSLSDQLTR